LSALFGQPDRGRKKLSNGHDLEVEQVEPWVAARNVGNDGDGRTGIGQTDVIGQFKQAEDRPILFSVGELSEGSEKVAGSPSDGCTAGCSVKAGLEGIWTPTGQVVRWSLEDDATARS
jgi:hypothetical protein